MAENFFALSRSDQGEVLQIASAATGHPAYLLEKDLWVVWTLRVLYESPLGGVLTFKGGTSLSKAYRIIDRFSEDIDLTCDMRTLLPAQTRAGILPSGRSQADKWTKAVEESLPAWIAAAVIPVVQAALTREKSGATVAIGGKKNEKLLLSYPVLAEGPVYVAPIVQMEFGGRSTGEPHAAMPIQCDMEGHVEGIAFPTATPLVMNIARTFWEKATAAHVYCAQHKLNGERYARHWYDLEAISRSAHFPGILADRAVAAGVARHKSLFFRAKDAAGGVIDYTVATQGQLRLVPEGDARRALAADYAAMAEAGVLLNPATTFDALMRSCREIEARINKA
jgi:hypothetical protein